MKVGVNMVDGKCTYEAVAKVMGTSLYSTGGVTE